MRDDLLDAFAVAELLGVSKNTAYRLINKGILAASGRWPRQVRRADVEEYLARCRIRPGDPRHLNQYVPPVPSLTMPGPEESRLD